MKREILFGISVILAVSFSGCYVEPGVGGSLAFDGTFDLSDDEFTMKGDLEFEGGRMPQDKYENITLELYAQNGTLLYKEHLGTIHNKSHKLNVSVSFSSIPYYVIFDSPDIWDGKTGIDYYVRSPDAEGGYRFEDTADRSELPIAPNG